MIVCIFNKFRVWGLCLLCIGGELAGAMNEAFGLSDRWQLIYDTWHVTFDTWHVTCVIYGSNLSLFVCFCPFWFWCYYLQMSRDSVSPINRIFHIILVGIWSYGIIQKIYVFLDRTCIFPKSSDLVTICGVAAMSHVSCHLIAKVLISQKIPVQKKKSGWLYFWVVVWFSQPAKRTKQGL